MQYCIQFNAHVSWEGRSNGLPSVLKSFLIYDGDDTKAINDLIEVQSGAFVRSQAFFTQREQGQLIDLRATPSDRMLVPLRWIVKIDVSLHPLTAELPETDEHGVQRLKNGEEPLKN